jgi:enediyne biosynthesis protein E4
MKYSPVRSAWPWTCCAAVALATTAAAQSTLGFDLVEVTKAPGPNHPGIDFVYKMVDIAPVESGGMAAADFDNDGRTDLWLGQTEGQPKRLYRNLGGGQFADEAQQRGVAEVERRRAMGAFFDLEGDGDLDLLTVGYGSHLFIDLDMYSLHRSNGAPAFDFTDVTASAGGFAHDLATAEMTLFGIPGGLAVADYDQDGFLDFWVNWWSRGENTAHDHPRLWHSVENPTPPAPGQADWSPRVFEDATVSAGLSAAVSYYHWQPAFVDTNRDGYPDLHVCIEAGEDWLRLNLKDGTFGPNVATSVGYNGNPALNRNEMGLGLGDIDNDLDLDAYKTNAEFENKLYRNDSEFGKDPPGIAFVDVSDLTGTGNLAWIAWGATFFDIDNDSDLDLAYTLGAMDPWPNFLHLNRFPAVYSDGKTPRFDNVSSQVPQFHHVSTPDYARGLLSFDYDGDGDLDLVTTRSGPHPMQSALSQYETAVYRNDSTAAKRWIAYDLRETSGSLNTVGAQIYLKTGGATGVIQSREIVCGSSFLCQEPARAHFGLGSSSIVTWTAVRWRNGDVQVQKLTSPDQVVVLTHGGTNSLGDVNGDGLVNGQDLIDLNFQIRYPIDSKSIWTKWPYLITGDLNADGTLDILDFAQLTQTVQGGS